MRLTVAEQLLHELGITEPEEIDLDAIAWHVGAAVKRRILDGCEARIIGNGDRAIITVNAASAFVRQRFSIGHEIGHWHFHRGRTLVCRSEDIGGRHNGGFFLERQADAFAGDLLMPGYILRPRLLQLTWPTFSVIRYIARVFNTSVQATAIRLVELGTWPTILVCHGRDGRKWFVRNRTVSENWFPRDDLSVDSYAFGLLFGNNPDQTKPQTTGAHTWFDRRDAERYEIHEQSVRSIDGETLTLLLFSDTRMYAEPRLGFCYRE